MKTISMTAYKRPAYEREVLLSLEKAKRPGWGWFRMNRDSFDCERLGVDANTLKAVSRAFEAGSDFNLHIEDDTVLSPDAIDLCDWFYSSPQRDDYVLLSLHSMSHEDAFARPLALYEAARFCPWGWAITRAMWERWILPEWGGKHRVDPKGWDWSVDLTVQRHGLKVLKPSLSRTRNIGRDGGTYETPGHWDEWTKGLTVSAGGYGTAFEITSKLLFLPPLDDWAVEEIRLEQEEKQYQNG